MRSFLKAVFILPLLVSCSGDDTAEVITPEVIAPEVIASCKLVSLKTEALVFDDLWPTAYNENYPEKMTFDHDDQNRISKVHGGFRGSSGFGSINGSWSLYSDVEDVVTYNQDSIAVDYSSNLQVKPYQKEFVVDDGKLTYQKSTSFNVASGTTTTLAYTYEYNGNTVIEKRNGILYRTFTFDNGNLIKSEQITYIDGAVYSRKIYEFSDYDNTENLLKGKFFINGCFLRAFSNNNFKKYSYTKYMTYNGSEEVVENRNATLTFSYNENNIASIFEQTCL